MILEYLYIFLVTQYYDIFVTSDYNIFLIYVQNYCIYFYNIYEKVVTTPEGELVRHEAVYTSKEPDFIKVYLDRLLTFKGVRKGLNPILLQFLSYMTYADSESAEGGQLIIINKYVKETIAKKLNLGIESVNKALTELTKAGIFRRVSSGTYQANPNLFGRGEWKDIKNIRAVFDFAEQNINAEIIKEEAPEDN